MAGFRDRRALQRLSRQQQAVEDATAQADLAIKRVSATIEAGYMLVASYDGSGISEQVVGLTATQTLTNKTLTTPAISSISNSGTITLPTGTRTLVARDTTDTLTNKTLTTPRLYSGTYADVVTATGADPGSGFIGMLAVITDSNTTTQGATVAGGSSNTVLAWHNGSNWVVA